MARSPHFRAGVYGLIAGFVEAGESIEAAVHREVYEETQILIKNLRYFGSQACVAVSRFTHARLFADYHAGNLVIDPTEIEDAGWYHYNDLPGRPSTNLSIAVKCWINLSRANKVTTWNSTKIGLKKSSCLSLRCARGQREQHDAPQIISGIAKTR